MKIYNMKDYAVIFCSLFTGLFCTVTASNDDSFSQATRTSFVGIPRKEGQIKDEAKANVPCVVKDIYGNFGRLRQLENQRLRGWDHNLFGFRSRRETEKGLVETCANQSNTHCFQEEERRDLLVNSIYIAKRLFFPAFYNPQIPGKAFACCKRNARHYSARVSEAREVMNQTEAGDVIDNSEAADFFCGFAVLLVGICILRYNISNL